MPEDPDAFPGLLPGETERQRLERQIRWLTKQAASPDGTGFWQMQLMAARKKLAQLDRMGEVFPGAG